MTGSRTNGRPETPTEERAQKCFKIAFHVIKEFLYSKRNDHVERNVVLTVYAIEDLCENSSHQMPTNNPVN